MKKGLTATQLKLIAICAMVVDHTAWGFVEMFTPLGQIMHVIGRLTIPIMCYFVAEGYKKTSNLKKYIERMIIFSIITIVPFYLFFGEEYGYRQNFFFDLTLALLALTVLDSKKLNVLGKTVLFSLISITSMVIGGWPMLPILLVLIFYYVKDFKKVCILVFSSICLVEVSVISLIFLNQIYMFQPQYADWVWYEWLYFFGFVLALPLIKLYNGERGEYPIGRYFFFMFYPVHFMVLWAVKQIQIGDIYIIYAYAHVLALFFCVALTVRVATSRPSRAQSAATVMGASGVIYLFGFIVEIYTNNVDIAFAGTVMEYFGECVVFMSFCWFISELCHYKMSKVFYSVMALFSGVILSLVFTTRSNHLFYTSITMDESGPFHKLDLQYGPGFRVFFIYMVIICGTNLVISIRSFINSYGIERKRVALILCGVMCPWLAIAAKAIGLTGGYEISAVGVFGSIFFIHRALISYGYFDSVQLAGENVLHHMDEGILVADEMMRILYMNGKMEELFPDVLVGTNVNKYETIRKMLSGVINSITVDGRYYEVKNVPLEEGNFNQGTMLYLRDMTEQNRILKETERFAHTDSLTGIYNRAYFKDCFEQMQYKKRTPGYVLMVDLDNFKKVNDENGHGVGDEVLKVVARTLLDIKSDVNLVGRIGGDEFCAFVGEAVTDEEIAEVGKSLINHFADYLEEANLKGTTSISVGAAFFNGEYTAGINPKDQLSAVYRQADEALYKAKSDGKGVCRIYGN